MIKRRIKQFIANFGYDIVPHDDTREPLRLNGERWLQARGIKTVLDVGAYDGGFARRIRHVLPEARIVSFEALKASYNELNSRMQQDPNFEAHLVALNNYNGKTTFHVSSY